MYSNEFNFLRFLNNLVHLDNDKYSQTISKVSIDKENKKSLVKSNTKILNFEKIIEEAFQNQSSPATVDGLYFNFNKNNKLTLFFIEFKGDDLTRKSWKSFFKDNILSLPANACKNQNVNCPIKNLEYNQLKTLYEHYNDEIIHQLHIKPIESILIGLPQLFENYANEKFEKIDIISNYIKCKIHIISSDSSKNKSNSHLTSKKEVKDKYSLYVNRKFFEYQTFNVEDYKENFIPKIDLFPISFIDIIISIVDQINENNLSMDDTSNILNNYLSKNKIKIKEQQKVKLIKTIKYYIQNS
ncbi:hypothetical protein [Methanobrevibacter millerae]|uniref:Uncharacterized protein n=1 Tax=Methanobrevibacter millerae TaxID=230361 RepID=A0A1G5XCT1_9EURY|nr:hypothetical protein [Methanobrevibacter millerae]SDA67537.1 hypothetical protein SAMN02910315_02095 [Methanobrevibacter millerae]